MASVVLRGLSKEFERGRPALSGVDLDVADGELLVLLGPSGSGKTTLLRLVAGLEAPTAGDVCIDGRRVNDVEPHQRDVGLMFQSPALYPHHTVAGNLAFGLELQKTPRREIETRVIDVADRLGLRDMLSRLPHELSGGQRQRVALGRALARRPAVLLLDEPLSQLDPTARSELRVELRRQNRSGVTMVLVTHDQEEAAALGDRVGLLIGGRLRQVAGWRTLRERPADVAVAGFVGSPPMNLLPARVTVDDGAVTVVVGALRTEVPRAFQARFATQVGRPLLLGIAADRVTTGPASGVGIVGTVEAVEGGDRPVARCIVEGRPFAVCLRPGERIAMGEQCGFRFDLGPVILFDAVTGTNLELA